MHGQRGGASTAATYTVLITLEERGILREVTGSKWVACGNSRTVRFYERNDFRADGTGADGAAFGGIAELRMVR